MSFMGRVLLAFALLAFFQDISCSKIPLVVHRRKDIAQVTIDLVSKGVIFTRDFLQVPEKTPAAVIAIHVNQSTLYVHNWRGSSGTESRKDEVQVYPFKETRFNVTSICRSNFSAPEETVNSLAVDWVTEKLYFGIEMPATQNHYGRIELCSLGGEKMCTVVLSSVADESKPKVEGLHFLVLDPVEGYMYWLNSMKKHIESAWMDGQHHVVNPFNQTMGPTVATTAGLTLDQESRSLYYVLIDTTKEDNKLWNCGLDLSKSCAEVGTLSRGHYLGVFKSYVLWTSIAPQTSAPDMIACNKSRCNGKPDYMTIETQNGFGAFVIDHPFIQPPRLAPNPCLDNNGNCSHFCTLIPRAPWRSCLCPVGRQLSGNGLHCIDRVNKVIFVATTSGLFYISLDTSHHIPLPVPSAAEIQVKDVDYDPVDKKLYFIDLESKVISRCKFDGSEFEHFANQGDPGSQPQSLAVDWLNRNIYWLDAAAAQIKIQSLTTMHHRVLLTIRGSHLKSLAVDPFNGFLYFSEAIVEEHISNFHIVKVTLDGSHREVLVKLDEEPYGIAVDSAGDRIYWSDRGRVLVRSASLANGAFKDAFNKSDNRPSSLSKLGDFLYYNSLFGRQIYMLNLTKENGKVSAEKIDVTIGVVIYGQENIRAVDLNNVPKGESPCQNNNGGCDHICTKQASGEKLCLCREGFELLRNGVKCNLPEAFLAFKQANQSDTVMRISLSSDLSVPDPINFDYKEAKMMPANISLDYGEGKMYWSSRISWSSDQQDSSQKIPGFQFLYSSFYNGTKVTPVVASEGIDDVSIDWITGNIYWCNVAYQRIEVSRHNGTFKRVIVWKNVIPHHLVVHPKRRFIAFVNTFSGRSAVHKLPLFGSADGDPGKAVFEGAGSINGLLIDFDNERFIWYSSNGSIGELLSNNFDGSELRKLISHSTFAPVSVAVYKGTIYFANAGSSAIETFQNGIETVLHREIRSITWLNIAYRKNFSDENECSVQNGRCPGLCLPADSRVLNGRSKCFCENHYTYVARANVCSPPEHFILLAAEHYILRLSLQRSGNSVNFLVEPFTILRIGSVGAPRSLDFDIYSSKRFVYWIDSRHDGYIQRSPDIFDSKVSNGKLLSAGQAVNVTRDVGCEKVLYLAIDNYGRQLYVTCVERGFTNSSSVHVFRIKPDDSLHHVGRVVDGSHVAYVRGQKPFPNQIALFPNLNMFFYIDLGAGKPQLIRCTMNGQKCTVCNTTNLKNSSRLHAFHNAKDRLFFTTDDGLVSHPDLVDLTWPERHLPLQHAQDFALISEDEVLVFDSEARSTRLSQCFLNGGKCEPVASILLPKVLAASEVIENDGSRQISHTCERSHCTHICIVHRGGSDNFECLCPLEHYMQNGNCTKTVRCAGGQFTCENGKECIDYSQLCDGTSNCEDSSDESPKLCKNNASKMWPCGDGTQSIARNKFCDGHRDCTDGSDEVHCDCLDPENDFDCRDRNKDRYKDPVRGAFHCVKRQELCRGLHNCSNMDDFDRERCQKDGDVVPTEPSTLSFEFALPFLIFFVIICAAIIICCCHFATRRTINNRCPAHPIRFNGGGAEAHVLLPLQMVSTLSVSHGSAIYNTVPAFNIPLSGSETSSRERMPGRFHSAANSSVPPSFIQEQDFTAPPPSAASLSTYGVVKPAGMKMYVDNRPGAASSLKRTRRKNKTRRSGMQKQRTPPPPYSQARVGSHRRKGHRSCVHGDGGHRAPTNTCVVYSSESSSAGESNREEMLNSSPCSSSSSSLDN